MIPGYKKFQNASETRGTYSPRIPISRTSRVQRRVESEAPKNEAKLNETSIRWLTLLCT